MIDKQKAWDIIVKLAGDEDNIVSFAASNEFVYAFLYAPNKQKAWNDICKISFERDRRAKSGIPFSISILFDFVPDKHQAWNLLHRLSSDDDTDLRWFSASLIGLICSRLTDIEKQQTWKDIHRLVYDNNGLVRSDVAKSFRYTFLYIFIN